MYVCMCVCVYVCVHVHVHHIPMHNLAQRTLIYAIHGLIIHLLYIHTHTYIHTHIHTHIHTYMHTYIHTVRTFIGRKESFDAASEGRRVRQPNEW